MDHFERALRYSRDGFLTLLGEKSFRQELIMLALTLPVTAWLKGLAGLFAVLPWGLLVLCAESLNTGIEKTVDLCTLERHPLAKAAKDTGSFACSSAIAAYAVVIARVLLS